MKGQKVTNQIFTGALVHDRVLYLLGHMTPKKLIKRGILSSHPPLLEEEKGRKDGPTSGTPGLVDLDVSIPRRPLPLERSCGSSRLSLDLPSDPGSTALTQRIRRTGGGWRLKEQFIYCVQEYRIRRKSPKKTIKSVYARLPIPVVKDLQKDPLRNYKIVN